MISGKNIRQSLTRPVAPDPYLCDVASRFETHRFLGGATQGVYQRLVGLLRDYALERYGTIDGLKVLDWGAGKGHITYLLQNLGFSVTSCDVKSEEADSSFGQETPIIHEKNIDIVPLTHEYQLPFETGSFDIVVSFGVLEHVPNDAESMKEIRRVLRDDGAFFFCFLPYWLSWTQKIAHMRGDFYHPRLYGIGDMHRFAEASGFDVGPIWHGQVLPKNALPNSPTLEKLDRMMTFWSPLKYTATNIEGFLFAR